MREEREREKRGNGSCLQPLLLIVGLTHTSLSFSFLSFFLLSDDSLSPTLEEQQQEQHKQGERRMEKREKKRKKREKRKNKERSCSSPNFGMDFRNEK